MNSPIFSKLMSLKTLALRVNMPTPDPIVATTETPYAAPMQSLSMRLLAMDESELLSVGSIEEAEDMVLTLPVFQAFDSTLPPASCSYTSLPIVINRAANMIASRSRRGGGNVALMHPDSMAILKNSTIGAVSLLPDLPRVGRWTHEGKLNSCIEIYSCPNMASEKIIVGYFGKGQVGVGTAAAPPDTIDAGVALVDSEDGLKLFVMGAHAHAMGDVSDYLFGITVE